MPIFHPIFEVEEEITVSVPSINSLAGDKLTAFAPNTIGIRYGKAKSMEIIKQLFDLGILFEHISNLKEIYRSYKNIARLESSFKDLKMPVEQYLDDSIETSFLICQLDFKGSTENDHTEELRNGIRRIKSHVFRGQYSLLKAKEDASKVACLASLIKRRQWGVDLDEIINNRSNINKIKDPESHYLWLIAAGVIG